MEEEFHEETQRVRKARITLLGGDPFFGSISFAMPILFDRNLNPPTAATNGQCVVFHPEFVMSLPKDELVFVVAHEVVHPALMHTLRRGKRDPERWNIACDIVVNHLLTEHRIGKRPKWAWYEPDLYYKGEGKVEKIYDLLPEDISRGDRPTDVVQDSTATDPQAEAATWRNNVQKAVQAAKAAGKMTSGLESLVEQLTVPKVSWQERLRSFAMTTKGKDRSWAKRNRRYAALDVMIPGTYGTQMGDIVFATDCSGSTSDRMVSQAGAELGSIQEELRPETIHSLYFDTEVKKHEQFTPDDPVFIKAYGRGGTCFRTVFEYIAKNGIEPECCIVATDMGCSDYGPPPPYPVLWLVLEGSYYAKPPWGEVLHVDKEMKCQ